MAYQKVMTAAEYVEKVFRIATEFDTFYKAKWPYNLGYHHADGRRSWDCWNLNPKTMIWGWDENGGVGYYCWEPGKYGLGDWGGETIMDHCEDVSRDFTNLIPAELLISPDNGHMGVYIGERIVNGRCYNVVECTTSWKENRVCLSYVSANGLRYHYKDGAQSSADPKEKAPTPWARHGKNPWVDYSVLPPGPPEPPAPTPEEPIYYTVVRGDALYKIAAKFDTTIAKLIEWNSIANPNLIYPGQKLIVGYKNPEPVPPEPEKVYYTVVRGDNLTKIARKFGTTVAQLVKWNNIPNKNLIYPGQVLRVK